MVSKEAKNRKIGEQGEKAKPVHIKATEPVTKAPLPPERNFPVVALGASAGGLEAFTQFLSNLSPGSGIAFILIQHLDPSHPSSLADLLSKQSPIPIREAKEGDPVEVDHAYIIPPGKAMSIHNRTLTLEEQPEHPGLTHSINLFFRSLAEDVKEQAVGIILSGTGTDGTDGARAIKAQDGLVIVHDPKTARYDGMPQSAIDAGLADYILPPEAMPAKLNEYLRQSSYNRDQIRQALKKDDSKLKSILSLVKTRTGRDFSGYKISSINRRIEHRMAVNNLERVEDYLKLLRANPVEIEALMKDFLIQVTSFFRDNEAFESLKQAIDKIVQARPEGSSLRAWIPGCSTGEEAYSIAIIILEFVQETGQNYEVQVFGTDLDAGAIAIARSGAYPDTIVQDVTPERLEKFFNKTDSTYQIKKSLRDRVIFAVHDLVMDPPYSRMDLVSVRNLLIYFDAELQQKVLPVLHYALNEGGLLFLGTSETIGNFTNLFATVDAKWRIYRTIDKKRAIPAGFSGQTGLNKAEFVKAPENPARTVPNPEPLLLLEALPPSVMVDKNYHLVYTHGDTSKYLRMAEGTPSDRILDLANPELGSILATLLHEASQGSREVVSENIQVKNNGGTRPVKITVRPLAALDGNLIVTFEDLPRPRHSKVIGKTVTEARHQEVEQKLRQTRDTLRSTIEELKTANEELRSANEEYMSTNEELKSANEELETSREELQSVNEELTTLNSEYQKNIEEMTSLNNDMQNLLNTTGVATIFLDEKLRIRRFTPAATRLFKFIESDIGRPVEDISSPLKDNVLVDAARRVLENLIPVAREVQTVGGLWYSLRILPYRAQDNNIAGVVASFVDINTVKAALQYANGILDNIREPFLVLDDKLRVVSASRAFYQTFHVKAEETEGKLIYELGNSQWDIPELRTMLKEVTEKGSIFEGYRVEHEFPGIGRRTMLLNARQIYDSKATQSILLAIEDITSRSGLEPFSQKKDYQQDVKRRDVTRV